MDTKGQGDWPLALTGLAFVVVGILTIAIGGDTPTTDDSARETVAFYRDNDTAMSVAAVLTCVAAVLAVLYAVYLRGVLRAAQPDRDGDLTPMVLVVGSGVLAAGLTLDAALSVALVDTAGDVSPAATQALSAAWNNDFPVFATGLLVMMLAFAVAILRHGALPKWMGWVAVVLVVLGPTPIGYVGFLGSLLFIAVTSVVLAVRGRRTAAVPAA